MKEIGAREAEGKLGALLDLVEQGEEVVITRGGRPVARLVPSRAARDVAATEAAVEEAERLRAGVTLGPGVTIRDLIDDGRR